MQKNVLFVAIFLISCLNGPTSKAQLTVAKIFGEHMILQRNTPTKIWGTSSPNDIIIFSLNRKTQKIKTDNSGNWKIILESQPAGGPHAISLGMFISVQVNQIWNGH